MSIRASEDAQNATQSQTPGARADADIPAHVIDEWKSWGAVGTWFLQAFGKAGIRAEGDEAAVRSYLAECGFEKADIRTMVTRARESGRALIVDCMEFPDCEHPPGSLCPLCRWNEFAFFTIIYEDGRFIVDADAYFATLLSKYPEVAARQQSGV